MKWDKCAKEIKKLDEFPRGEPVKQGNPDRGSFVFSLHLSNEAACSQSQQELIQNFIMGPFQTMQQAWCQMGTRVHFVAAWSSCREKYLPCAEHQAH